MCRAPWRSFEFYCPDPACDCRRVMLNVVEEKRPDHFLASISYAFDRDDDMAGPFLDPLNPQSRYAENLLDPKYRVSDQSLDQAIDELHRYKDAIFAPDQRRLVSTALALCPSDERAKGRYFDTGYIQTHGLGALVLQPGETDAMGSLASSLGKLIPDLCL